MNNQTVSRRYWIHYTHTVQFDCWYCQYAYKFIFCSTIYMFYLLINRIKKNSIDNSFGVTSLIHWVEIDRIMWMLTLFFFVNNKTIDHIHATDLGEKTVYSNSCLNNWTWIGNKSEIQNRWIQAIQTRNFNMILMIFTCLWKRN